MENVLTALVVMFLFIFGTFTITQTVISSHDVMQSSLRAMESRTLERLQTSLTLLSAHIVDSGSTIELVVRNDGDSSLIDFSDWDVIIEYFDNADPATYHIEWLPYDQGAAAGTWTTLSLYLNAEQEQDELQNRSIFDPDEEMVIRAYLLPPVGIGNLARVHLATDNGVTTSIQTLRNIAPELTTNEPLKVALGGQVTLTNRFLEVTDVDNDPSELIYTVLTPPEQGELTPETEFSQEDINTRTVTYKHTGTEADSFVFRVFDGTDEIGDYTFQIELNTAPSMSVYAGLTLPTGGTATITNGLLRALDDDPDDPPADLIYTITKFPSNGILSLGSTFSQEDIDSNRLTYTHTGAQTADSFEFMVSDGYDVIGTYTFLITMN
ncbi:MAG: hypothetical protein IT320_23155 [Anaerolineae bacterium]|nr:hypothetical protein [Anaerolineae bacterium]